MQLKDKRLRIMAGPNGSGKSTVLKEVRKNFYSGPFVNADEIEKIFHQKKLLNLPSEYDLIVEDAAFDNYLNSAGKSWIEKALRENINIEMTLKEGILLIDKVPSPYDAALAADFVRNMLLEKGETFTFETVMSHHSKIDFLDDARKKGFKNYLYFICTIDPAINIERVRQRVLQGGHAVPEDKIVKRYYESLNVLPEIIPLCYRVYLFDNSLEENALKPVAEINNNFELIIKDEQLPWWVQEHVINKLFE